MQYHELPEMRSADDKRIGMENKISENHKKYTERASLYKKFGYDIEKERNFIFEKAKPISGRILEVGTGKGHFALELAKAGYRFTSIDISEEEQETARLNLQHAGLESKVDLKIEDAENLSFKDSSFDVIFSINALHHFANPNKVIDELVRVLNKGGKIVFSDFTKEGFSLLDRIHKAEGRHHHQGEVSLEDVDKYLQNKAFKTEQYKTKFQEILTTRI